MKNTFCKFIDSVPFGYAYHKIILDETNIPIDYEFIEANHTFEKLTGLEPKKIIGQKITSVLPMINKSDFDWIGFYGDIALNGGSKTFEQFSEPLQKWFQVQVFSYERGFFATIFIDITEHKAMESELAAEKQRLHDIIIGTNIGTWEWHVQTGDAVFNERWAEIIGYTLQEISPVSIKTWEKFAHPDDLKESMKYLEKHFRGETDYYDFESRMKHKNGHWIWVLDRGKVSKWNKDGTPQIMSGTHQDISEQKIIAERLKASEENFRTFFETIDDIIIIGNRQGDIYFTNHALKKKLGYTTKQLSKMHFLDFHPAENRREAQLILEEILNGKRQSCPLPLAAGNGAVIPVETRIWFGQWDGHEAIFAISKDLSKEQEALQKFNKLFENNPALMAVNTLEDRKFVEVNDSFLNTLGFAKDEVIGKTLTELNTIAEPQKIEEVNRQLQEKGNFRNVELKIKTKSGTILNGLFSGEIIKSQGKKYFLTVMTDITAREKAEIITDTTNNAKAEFIADLNREIRTPLGNVIEFTDLLLQTPLSELQKHYADTANTSGKNLQNIINNILDSSKIAAEKPEPKEHLITENNRHFDKKLLQKTLNHNRDLYIKLIAYAKTDTANKISALTNAVAEIKVQEIKQISHAIKGQALNMRFSLLAKLAEKIEQNAETENFTQVEKALLQLKKEWAYLLKLLSTP